MARGSGMKKLGGKSSSSFTGKSKVISSGTLKGTIPRPRGHMFGDQSVKAAKPR